jgi:hypothetical protein
MTVFGARQVQNLLTPREPGRQTGRATDAFEAVTRATEEQLSGPLENLFRAGDSVQHGLLRVLFGGRLGDVGALGPRPDGLSETCPTTWPGGVEQPSTGTHLVLGEGLAAGMGDFSLSEETQRYSFPRLLTQQMGIPFAQPLIQAPGLGSAVGFPCASASLPAILQTTVLEEFPPAGAFSNLSIPGLKVGDLLTLRPIPPLIHRDDEKQTAVNLLFGCPDLLGGATAAPTLLELALRQSPLCFILELGYYDFLEPAVTGNLSGLPDVAPLCAAYDRILGRLAATKAEVLLLTVPDPIDTAHFSTTAAAAGLLRVEPEVLERAYRLPRDSLINVNGLVQMAEQMLIGRFQSLRPGSVLSAESAGAICDRVDAVNAELQKLADKRGAVVYDLHGLFRRVRQEGIRTGVRQLTADYLGGFYSLNGYYPGPTGQAVICSELVQLVNATHGTSYGAPDVQTILAADPVADYQAAAGQVLSWDQIARNTPAVPTCPGPRRPVAQMAWPTAAPKAQTAAPPSGASRQALRLPPGLEQQLSLNHAFSYHGDAIRAVHCPDQKESRFGSCGKLLFGGLAMFGSHVSGDLHMKFTPPVDGVTHFEIDWGDGLVGDDGILSAPQFFRLPASQARVLHWPGTVVSGDLNLETAEVTNLDCQVQIVNSALGLLIRTNPNFPRVPVRFPGDYGTAWARFDQRPDDKLDFSFFGRTFIPLGPGVRFPLPFGAAGMPAHVPADGTALHPHVYISTKEYAAATISADVPEFPCNAVREFTLFSHNSNFGDKFSLNNPNLGEAQGRSQVVGRVQVQFGERFGDSLPVAIATLPLGGLLLQPEDSPIAQAFPGRLPAGLLGHDEFLRFALRTYFLDNVELVDDPFDLALGAVDVKTGYLLSDLTHRGFINQNLFFALVRVEPRTPRSSFYFRGPACFERGVNGQLIYRFNGAVHIPYPEGFLFPAPDLATGYAAGPNSALDPFLRLQAMNGGEFSGTGKRGSADSVIASNGNRFSYGYAIPSTPQQGKAVFEYTNHTQGGTFCMLVLAWASFTHSRGRPDPAGEADTVTFTGYGTWSKDLGKRLHVATVQVSTSRDFPYVSIQIDGGMVSNVNTKPEVDATTLA